MRRKLPIGAGVSCCTACLLLLISGLAGMSVRPLALDEMVAYSHRIFRGICLSAEPDGVISGLPVTRYTFRILEEVKGATGERTISFRQIGSAGESFEIPRYRVEAEYVLFLYPESEIGLTSPVGLLQGAFQVMRLSVDGEPLVRNGVGNRNLFSRRKGAAEAAPERRSLSPTPKLGAGALTVEQLLSSSRGEVAAESGEMQR